MQKVLRWNSVNSPRPGERGDWHRKGAHTFWQLTEQEKTDACLQIQTSTHAAWRYFHMAVSDRQAIIDRCVIQTIKRLFPSNTSSLWKRSIKWFFQIMFSHGWNMLIRDCFQFFADFFVPSRSEQIRAKCCRYNFVRKYFYLWKDSNEICGSCENVFWSFRTLPVALHPIQPCFSNQGNVSIAVCFPTQKT